MARHRGRATIANWPGCPICGVPLGFNNKSGYCGPHAREVGAERRALRSPVPARRARAEEFLRAVPPPAVIPAVPPKRAPRWAANRVLLPIPPVFACAGCGRLKVARVTDLCAVCDGPLRRDHGRELRGPSTTFY